MAVVRWRMTIEIEDHGVIRTGSAVWATSGSHVNFSLDGQRYRIHFAGDAIPIRMGSGQTLYILPTLRMVRGPGNEGLLNIPLRNFSPIYQAQFGEDLMSADDRVAALRWLGEQQGAQVAIDCPLLPTEDRQAGQGCPFTVTFADATNPATVEAADLGALPARFGPRVRTRSITATIVDEPVTRGQIGEILPWLSRYCRGRRFDDFTGGLFGPNDPIARQMSTSLFSYGVGSLCRP